MSDEMENSGQKPEQEGAGSSAAGGDECCGAAGVTGASAAEAEAKRLGKQMAGPADKKNYFIPRINSEQHKGCCVDDSLASQPPPNLQEEAKKTRWVAKTRLEHSASQASSQLPPKLKEVAGITKGVARTLLDHGAVKDVVKRSFAEQEARLAEELKNRPPEQLKPHHPVDRYKAAAPCSSKWKSGDKEERVLACQLCHLRVYDLMGMEQPEADELAFKMEGRRNVVFFKRQDGKFLTGNCPVGERQQLMNKAALAFGAATIIAIVALFLTQPPQHDAAVSAGNGKGTSDQPSLSDTDKNSKTSQKAASVSPAAWKGYASGVNVMPPNEMMKSIFAPRQHHTAEESKPFASEGMATVAGANVMPPDQMMKQLFTPRAHRSAEEMAVPQAGASLAPNVASGAGQPAQPGYAVASPALATVHQRTHLP